MFKYSKKMHYFISEHFAAILCFEYFDRNLFFKNIFES